MPPPLLVMLLVHHVVVVLLLLLLLLLWLGGPHSPSQLLCSVVATLGSQRAVVPRSNGEGDGDEPACCAARGGSKAWVPDGSRCCGGIGWCSSARYGGVGLWWWVVSRFPNKNPITHTRACTHPPTHPPTHYTYKHTHTHTLTHTHTHRPHIRFQIVNDRSDGGGGAGARTYLGPFGSAEATRTCVEDVQTREFNAQSSPNPVSAAHAAELVKSLRSKLTPPIPVWVSETPVVYAIGAHNSVCAAVHASNFMRYVDAMCFVWCVYMCFVWCVYMWWTFVTHCCAYFFNTCTPDTHTHTHTHTHTRTHTHTHAHTRTRARARATPCHCFSCFVSQATC
jgi:hypothetical protein